MVLSAITIGIFAQSEAGADTLEMKKIDEWLSKNGLNEYGDDHTTTSYDESPLLDHESGQMVDRHVYFLNEFPNKPWDVVDEDYLLGDDPVSEELLTESDDVPVEEYYPADDNDIPTQEGSVAEDVNEFYSSNEQESLDDIPANVAEKQEPKL